MKLKSIIFLIALSIFIFLSSSTSLSAAEMKHIEYDYMFQSVHEDNINLSSNNGYVDLTLTELYSDDYYLIKISSLDGTLIDYTYNDNVEVVDSDSDEIKDYIQDCYFIEEFTYYDFIRIVDNQDVLIKFEEYPEYKISVLRRTLFTENKIDNDSNIIKDLAFLNNNFTKMVSEEFSIIGIIPVKLYGNVCFYIYCFNPDNLKVNSIDFKVSEEVENVRVLKIDDYSNIYKYSVSSFDSDFFINNKVFEIEKLYTSERLVDGVKGFVKEQKIVFEYFIKDKMSKVDFGTIDSSYKKITGEVYSHTITGNFEEEILGQLFGDERTVRFHYALFDIYVNNEKLINPIHLTEINYSYNYRYDCNESYVKFKGFQPVEILNPEDSMNPFIISKRKDFIDINNNLGTGVEVNNMEVGSKVISFDYKQKVENIADFIGYFFGSQDMDGPYEFNTLVSKYDHNPKWNKMDFKDFNFSFYLGHMEDNKLTFGKEVYKDEFNWSNYSYSYLYKYSAEPIVYGLDVSDVKFDYKGNSYSITIDENDWIYKGEGPGFGNIPNPKWGMFEWGIFIACICIVLSVLLSLIITFVVSGPAGVVDNLKKNGKLIKDCFKSLLQILLLPIKLIVYIVDKIRGKDVNNK